jgi:hypothetical protein
LSAIERTGLAALVSYVDFHETRLYREGRDKAASKVHTSYYCKFGRAMVDKDAIIDGVHDYFGMGFEMAGGKGGQGE